MYLTDVVKNLLILNILMFVAGLIFDPSILSLHYPGSAAFQPYQIVTHFFMHAGVAHLFFNMFALVMFGSQLEALMGPRRFLFYYFFCAIGGAVLHMSVDYFQISHLESLAGSFADHPTSETFHRFFENVPFKRLNVEFKEAIYEMGKMLDQGNPNISEQALNAMQQFIDFKKSTQVVGASGAIFGLLLAFGVFFPNQELMLIFFPVPIKAKFFIPLLMLIELFLGMKQFSWDNIAHFAHLGGALFGLLLILFWRKRGDRLY
jgi:membrane associated rhomboid family serine protease